MLDYQNNSGDLREDLAAECDLLEQSDLFDRELFGLDRSCFADGHCARGRMELAYRDFGIGDGESGRVDFRGGIVECDQIRQSRDEENADRSGDEFDYESDRFHSSSSVQVNERRATVLVSG